MSRISWSIFLLFSITALLWLTQQLSQDKQLNTEPEDELLVPDYIANNMKSTLYSDKGIANHFLQAGKMEHYDLLGFTSFTDPIYEVFIEQNQTPWRLTAKEATLYAENKLVFEQNVLLSSLDEQGYVRQIATQYMELQLDDHTMETDQAITISGANFKIKGKGMKGDLRKKQIQLLDHVKTTYQNEKS